MHCAMIFDGKLYIGDARYRDGNGRETPYFSMDTNFDSPNQMYRAFTNPKLVSLEHDDITITTDEGEIKLVPYDHVGGYFMIEKTIALRVLEPEPPRPPESEGDPNCKHETRDDGDNLQIFCTKCGMRSNVKFTAKPMRDPLLPDDM